MNICFEGYFRNA